MDLALKNLQRLICYKTQTTNQPGATTPGQSGPGSNGNEVVLRIPQSSTVTGASPSDCLVSYLGHSLEESYPSAEKHSVYSTAPVDWATRNSTDKI